MIKSGKAGFETLLIAFMGLVTGAAIMLLIAYAVNKPTYLSNDEVVHILNTRKEVLQNEVAQTKSVTFEDDWVCFFDKVELTATVCSRSFMASLADSTIGTGSCIISSHRAPVCFIQEKRNLDKLASITALPEGEYLYAKVST